MKFFQQTNKKNNLLQKGFTLIELIVVIGIFTIILGIALFNQGKLNNNILVSNLAYEIALAVREAQSYGIGVRTATGSDFNGGYGISINFAQNTNQLILFNDKNNTGTLETGEEVSRYTIENQRGNTIKGLCIGPLVVPCVAGNSKDVINIIFKRPNPDAKFLYSVDSAGNMFNTPGPIYIVVNTPSNSNCRVVVVEQTGQISVEDVTGGHCSNAGN